jgi:hypothetical protein
MPNTPKRPADMMQLAKLIGQIATGEVTEAETAPTPAQARASKGGVARAKSLTPKKRVAIARKGAKASAKARKRP